MPRIIRKRAPDCPFGLVPPLVHRVIDDSRRFGERAFPARNGMILQWKTWDGRRKNPAASMAGRRASGRASA
jgi:hypothetical protein